jgi:hypothetical protein
MHAWMIFRVSQGVQSLATSIYLTYLADDSPHQVNLPKAVSHPLHRLFRPARMAMAASVAAQKKAMFGKGRAYAARSRPLSRRPSNFFLQPPQSSRGGGKQNSDMKSREPSQVRGGGGGALDQIDDPSRRPSHVTVIGNGHSVASLTPAASSAAATAGHGMDPFTTPVLAAISSTTIISHHQPAPSPLQTSSISPLVAPLPVLTTTPSVGVIITTSALTTSTSPTIPVVDLPGSPHSRPPSASTPVFVRSTSLLGQTSRAQQPASLAHHTNNNTVPSSSTSSAISQHQALASTTSSSSLPLTALTTLIISNSSASNHNNSRHINISTPSNNTNVAQPPLPSRSPLDAPSVSLFIRPRAAAAVGGDSHHTYAGSIGTPTRPLSSGGSSLIIAHSRVMSSGMNTNANMHVSTTIPTTTTSTSSLPPLQSSNASASSVPLVPLPPLPPPSSLVTSSSKAVGVPSATPLYGRRGGASTPIDVIDGGMVTPHIPLPVVLELSFNVFDDAAKCVFTLMETDVYQRYLRSPGYKTLIDSLTQRAKQML